MSWLTVFVVLVAMGLVWGAVYLWVSSLNRRNPRNRPPLG